MHRGRVLIKGHHRSTATINNGSGKKETYSKQHCIVAQLVMNSFYSNIYVAVVVILKTSKSANHACQTKRIIELHLLLHTFCTHMFRKVLQREISACQNATLQATSSFLSRKPSVTKIWPCSGLDRKRQSHLHRSKSFLVSQNQVPLELW
jgi:hypothetical protein